MMAETPDLDVVRDSEDDGMLDSEYSSRKSSAAHGFERSRVAKSPSEHSYTESVISVIEMPHLRGSPSMPGLSNGHHHEYNDNDFNDTAINQTPKVSLTAENDRTSTLFTPKPQISVA